MINLLEYIRSENRKYLSTETLDNPEELFKFIKDNNFIKLDRGSFSPKEMISAGHKVYISGKYRVHEPGTQWVAVSDGYSEVLFIRTTDFKLSWEAKSERFKYYTRINQHTHRQYKIYYHHS